MKYYAIKKDDSGVEVYDVTERMESLRKTKYYDEPTAKWTLAREMNAEVFDEELAKALGLLGGKIDKPEMTREETTTHVERLVKIPAHLMYKPTEREKTRWAWEVEYATRKGNIRELAELALATKDESWFMEITDGYKQIFRR